jgi:hypothetical protein
MAYNRFKLKDLEDKFNIQNFNKAFIDKQLPTVVVDDFLLKTLTLASEEALGTEKAKSELVISPVIKYFKDRNAERLSYFSGYEFNVDTKLGLNGFCDYIISTEPHKYTIEAPVICLVEAKKGEIEGGFGQCGAEMYASQLFNEQAGHVKNTIYGCVTNAFSWAFLKLEGKNLYIDPNYVPLTFTEPQRVLAVLQWILDCSLANK